MDLEFLVSLAEEVGCRTDLISRQRSGYLVYFMGDTIGGWVRHEGDIILVHFPRIDDVVKFDLKDPSCFDNMRRIFNGD